jgi:hypothetical protein
MNAGSISVQADIYVVEVLEKEARKVSPGFVTIPSESMGEHY